MKEEQSADLIQVLLDCAHMFEELHIRYALVGGLAAMVYGRARFTEDVDLITYGDHESILREHKEVMQKWNFDPGCTWKLYHSSGLEVDLWKDQFVDEMVLRATTTTLAEHKIPIIDRLDLIAMKLRAARPQDDYDISEILKRGEINEETLKQRVGDEEFTHYLSIKKRTHS